MSFNPQRAQKLTLCLFNLSLITVWTVIGGCAQSLNSVTRATNSDEAALIKKKSDPRTDKIGSQKIVSNDVRPEERVSSSEADVRNEDVDAASKSSSNRAVRAETEITNRFLALEEAIRQQNEKLSQQNEKLSQMQKIIEQQE